MREPDRARSWLGGVLRWGIATSVALLMTGSLFVAMAGLIDGSWLLEQLIRVFPLSQTELGDEERCRLAAPPVFLFEGTVGTRVDGRFVALGDAQIQTEGGLTASRRIAVSPDGDFRIGVPLPDTGSRGCGEAAAPAPQLLIRASGCEPRRVPVTRAWTPRRIVLRCARG